MKPTIARGLAVASLALSTLSTLAAGAAQAQVHDQLVIPTQPVDGHAPSELSGLAWDADEQTLYAVSDRGILFAFALRVDKLHLQALKPLRATRLQAPPGQGTPNAEGLALANADNGTRGDTELIVAAENGPALLRYGPQGQPLGALELPAPLRDPDAYRSKNARLESVALDPRHGALTAPQRSLAALPPSLHRIYASDGRHWDLTAGDRGAVKGLETLADGGLLVLERVGRGRDIQAVLRRLDPASCGGGTACQSEPITLPGLAAGDNYEGLARLDHGLFLIVSDDGGKGRLATRLVLFSLPKN